MRWILLAALALGPPAVFGQQEKNQPEAAQAKPEETPVNTEAVKADKDAKEISGMSILGNQDAPKSLVIVPWKSSEIGQSIGISTLLDDSKLPVDKEVFMRMLSYYEIRTEVARPAAVPNQGKAVQSATAAPRRKP
jgi:hypothetical protein